MADKRDIERSIGRTIRVPKVLVRQVRSLIQDFPTVNELFEGEESSDEKIARHLVEVIEDWNGTPPLLSFKLDPLTLQSQVNFQGPRTWIVNATAARVLRSVMFKLARNDVPYTAGSVTIQPSSVWRNLQPLVQEMEAEYRANKQGFKIAQNVSGAFGDGGYRAALTEHYYGTDADMIAITL
jgi:hypothetical protein